MRDLKPEKYLRFTCLVENLKIIDFIQIPWDAYRYTLYDRQLQSEILVNTKEDLIVSTPHLSSYKIQKVDLITLIPNLDSETNTEWYKKTIKNLY